MMDLHSRIPKKELADPERFDFLRGVKDLVIRMDEVHPSADNDGHYLFLIWVKPSDYETARRLIVNNWTNADLDRDWTYKVLPHTGVGLIIVSTWI